MMPPLYSVHFYVNGLMTNRVPHLIATDAYTQAIPGEALQGARWHVLMRMPALQRLSALLAGESLRVCWQDPPENIWADTEHILILKEPLHIDNNTIPIPIPNQFNRIYNGIDELINNINNIQNNQNNNGVMMNNVYNRLVELQNAVNPNLIQ